jgi:hypothetical protein
MDQRLLERVTEAYLRLGPDLLEPLLDLFGAARQVGGGDVHKLMIMMVVGLRTAAHPVFRERTAADVVKGSDLVPTLGVNSRSLAETLAIPRETVRRKVIELVDAGWLARDGHNLHYTAVAMRELAPFRKMVVRMAAANYETISDLQRKPTAA